MIPTPEEIQISELCKLSLEKKWRSDSEYHTNDGCPFCDEMKERTNEANCEGCICPPTICANHANEGIMKRLPRDMVRDLPSSLLEEVRDEFKKYIIREDSDATI